MTSSRWAGVMCSRGQVEAVCVVMEHQQTVEVLASSQDSVFVAPPRHRTVSKTVNRQWHPGLRLRLLQVTPVGQVRTRLEFTAEPDLQKNPSMFSFTTSWSSWEKCWWKFKHEYKQQSESSSSKVQKSEERGCRITENFGDLHWEVIQYQNNPGILEYTAYSRRLFQSVGGHNEPRFTGNTEHTCVWWHNRLMLNTRAERAPPVGSGVSVAHV